MCAVTLDGNNLGKNILTSSESLKSGQKLSTKNGTYFLLLQRDGNLELHKKGDVIWASRNGFTPLTKGIL